MLSHAATWVPGLGASEDTEEPVDMTTPATSEPTTAGYELMKTPKSRCIQSTGLSATDLTSIRSSLGAGVGVGRWRTSRAEPFDGRMAARCSSDLVSLKTNDMIDELID